MRCIVITALQYCGPLGFSTGGLGLITKTSFEESSPEKKHKVSFDPNESKSEFTIEKTDKKTSQLIQSLFSEKKQGRK